MTTDRSDTGYSNRKKCFNTIANTVSWHSSRKVMYYLCMELSVDQYNGFAHARAGKGTSASLDQLQEIKAWSKWLLDQNDYWLAHSTPFISTVIAFWWLYQYNVHIWRTVHLPHVIHPLSLTGECNQNPRGYNNAREKSITSTLPISSLADRDNTALSAPGFLIDKNGTTGPWASQNKRDPVSFVTLLLTCKLQQFLRNQWQCGHGGMKTAIFKVASCWLGCYSTDVPW